MPLSITEAGPDSTTYVSTRKMMGSLVPLLLLLVCVGFSPAAWSKRALLPSIAFYYGGHIPVGVLHGFDWVVIQPDHLKHVELLENRHTRVFAYVSLGEVDTGSRLSHTLPGQCRLGVNRPWHSVIVNQAISPCRTFYLRRIIRPLLQRGFRNFFFDTLDSYRLVLKSPDRTRAYQKGLIALIKAIHSLDPQGRFILNRGFPLLEGLKGQGVIAVAGESLYKGWDQHSKHYISVSPDDRSWLLTQFHRVRKLGLTPIAIDYLPPGERNQAEQLAQAIAKEGIVPYIGDASLDSMGISTITPTPRRILMLYEGRYRPMSTNLNWYAAMPLNHLGYTTRAIDVSQQGLPGGPLNGQVAGIVTWFNHEHFKHARATWRWLRAQIHAGVPVVVLGNFGLPMRGTDLASLGLKFPKPVPVGLFTAHIRRIEPAYMGFEAPIFPSAPDFFPLRLERGHSLLSISLADTEEVAAANTSWGGYILNPYVVRNLPQGSLTSAEVQAQWLVNPFRFFRAALKPPQVPVYDYTTASGRRLLFGLIDGDGFASGSWIGAFRDQPAAKVILEQVLKRYPLPITASVIASEFVDGGLYPLAEVARLRPVAQAIFRLPWVEIGSHTYSHPFDWPALERDPDLSAGLHLKSGRSAMGAYVIGGGGEYGYNLAVPGYRFSPRMEVIGSTRIIDRVLAPPGKRVRIIQWSGDTNPDAQVLGLAYHAGLMNINGDNSTITRAHPSLTNVVPLGVWKGPYFQVYSPIANEDQYTHGWQPPYCGYDKAIQTMKMTDRPRRLTAMEIYYHFYSGARACGFKNLLQVYRWAGKQSATPVFASTYSHIALGFENASMTSANGGFLARNYGLDQELRIPPSMGFPDLARSRNIAGYDDFDGQRYIHLGPGNQAMLYLQPVPPHRPYLISANGLIRMVGRNGNNLRLVLQGYVPLQFDLGNVRTCTLRVNGHSLEQKITGLGSKFKLKVAQAVIDIHCPD